VADAFRVQQAPVSSVADLGHGGQVRQLFADSEVARLVQRDFGPGRSSFLQVLFDLDLLVEQVKVWADPGGDHLGAEGPEVRPLPRCRTWRPNTMLTLSARPMSMLSRISCLKKTRPLAGRSSVMVVQNSIC
jgi:hypothetical protein